MDNFEIFTGDIKEIYLNIFCPHISDPCSSYESIHIHRSYLDDFCEYESGICDSKNVNQIKTLIRFEIETSILDRIEKCFKKPLKKNRYTIIDGPSLEIELINKDGQRFKYHDIDDFDEELGKIIDDLEELEDQEKLVQKKYIIKKPKGIEIQYVKYLDYGLLSSGGKLSSVSLKEDHSIYCFYNQFASDHDKPNCYVYDYSNSIIEMFGDIVIAGYNTNYRKEHADLLAGSYVDGKDVYRSLTNEELKYYIEYFKDKNLNYIDLDELVNLTYEYTIEDDFVFVEIYQNGEIIINTWFGGRYVKIDSKGNILEHKYTERDDFYKENDRNTYYKLNNSKVLVDLNRIVYLLNGGYKLEEGKLVISC